MSHHSAQVRTWDGMQAVWLVYESYAIGRVEAALDLRPANTKMLGKEEHAQELLFTVSVRTWHADERQAFWSTPGRASLIVEQNFSEKELENWIINSVSDALERASREMGQ